MLTLDTFECSSIPTVDPCIVLTRSPRAEDIKEMHLVPGAPLTYVIGVVPFEIDKLGYQFGPVFGKIIKQGPVKVIVTDGFTKDQQKAVRRQFPNSFKGTRADLPEGGVSHDDIVSRLELQSKALEGKGQGVADVGDFFQTLVNIHRDDGQAKRAEDAEL